MKLRWFLGENSLFQVISTWNSSIFWKTRNRALVTHTLFGSNLFYTGFILDLSWLTKAPVVLVIYKKVAPKTSESNHSIQWHQQYFNANETAMNYALMIVFLQKFHRKILDFCIFEKLSKFFIYQPQNRSLKSSLFSILLDSPRGVLCEIGVSHCFYKIAKHPPL